MLYIAEGIMTIVGEFAACFLFVIALAIIFVAGCGIVLLLKIATVRSARVFREIRTPALVPAAASVVANHVYVAE
jgi:hypothetical protein